MSNNDGDTRLCISSYEGHLEVVRFLLANKANKETH